MTEDEAKTKWCPFARVDATSETNGMVTGVFGGGNRIILPGNTPVLSPSEARCIGSACMAWRMNEGFHYVPNTALDYPGGLAQLAANMTAAGYTLDDRRMWWSKPHAPSGYCGLAGKPA